MRQCFALVAVEQNDVACFGLLFAQLQTQADPIHLARYLASFQRVPRPPLPELFFRKALDSCERLMRTPSRASISARMRGIVQLGRSATGCSSRGVTTRNAASLFTGAGPGATLAFSASTPPLAKSLRHRRTEVPARRMPRQSRGRLNQPASAAPPALDPPLRDRGREAGIRATREARCSSFAVTGDFPAISNTCELVPTANCTPIRWSTWRNLLRAGEGRGMGCRVPSGKRLVGVRRRPP